MTSANLLPAMSSVARVQSARRSLRPRRERFSPHESGTLEQRLDRSLQDLQLRGTAECPLCQAPMQRAADGAGECTGCGTKLS